jgi:hypothetical protein
MPSIIKSDRAHMDESVLSQCPELQAIPMNKPQLAATAGGKIYRPQQAAYMFQNLPISKAKKESLLYDFVERSMKTNPITFPAHRYATRTPEHLLVVPSTTRTVDTQTPQFAAAAALAAHDQATQTNPGNVPPIYSVVDPNIATQEPQWLQNAQDHLALTPQPPQPPQQSKGKSVMSRMMDVLPQIPRSPLKMRHKSQTQSPLPLRLTDKTQASSSNAPLTDWQDLVIRDPEYSKLTYRQS